MRFLLSGVPEDPCKNWQNKSQLKWVPKAAESKLKKRYKTPLEIREKAKIYYAAHREERLAKQLEYAKSHREENNMREKRRREAHPRRHARLKKEEYKRNIEKRRKANNLYNFEHRFEKAAASRAWRLKHPRWAKTLSIESKHIYRARLANAEGRFTLKQFRELCKKYKYTCICCGNTEDQLFDIQRMLVPDQVVPISKGGSNFIDNIQPLCHAIKGGRGGCNNTKHNTEIDYRNTSLAKSLLIEEAA